jgi:hypothetical protein
VFGDATSLFNIDGNAIVAVNAEREHAIICDNAIYSGLAIAGATGDGNNTM